MSWYIWCKKMISGLGVCVLILLLPTQLGLHLWPASAYLQGLRIDYLAPTLYAYDTVIILWYCMLVWQKKAPRISLLLILLIGINTTTSLVPFHTGLHWLRMLLSWYVYIDMFNKYKQQVMFLLIPMSLWQLTLVWQQFDNQSALQGVWYWLGERAIYPWMPDVAQTSLHGRLLLRPYGTFSHPNAMGGFFLVVHFLLVQYQYTTTKGLLAKGIGLFCAAAVLCLSFSRSTLLTFACIHILLLFTDARMRLCKMCFLARPLMLLVLIVVFASGTGDIYSASKRLYLLQQAYTQIPYHLATGTGFGGSVRLTAEYVFLNIPLFQPVHSVYILWILETGLVGVVWLIYTSYQKRHLIWRDLHTSAPLVAICVTALFDHYWLTQPQNMRLLLLVCAWLLSHPPVQKMVKYQS
jgi:hypothetical protein